MSYLDTLAEMDPAARAVAEVRAREAGLTLSQWMEWLVFEHGAPLAPRSRTYYGGAHLLGTGPATAGSYALSTSIWPDVHYDTDVAPHWLRARHGPVATANYDRLLAGVVADDSAWSALRMITLFPPRIDQAAMLMSAAFAEGAVADFELPTVRRVARKRASASYWYETVVHTCINRSREVRNALVHRWTPRGRAEQLWGDAFFVLSELTPVRQELVTLCLHDRSRAAHELARHLEIVTQQFELSANLLSEVDASETRSDEQRFAELRNTLLERAGGGLSLTEAAKSLGVSRQALHKRIKSGTALGMMNGSELVLPRLQWMSDGDKVVFVPGVDKIVRLFERAGGWSALQFLVDEDPNLEQPPIEALLAGRLDDTVAAARAYLGLDEG